jgi:hypothetical protein
MNIEKIFSAVQNDEMNSALGTICLELENQGYKMKIEEIEISSEEIFNGKAEYLEQYPYRYNFVIENRAGEKQRFAIRFTEYHKFIFEQE